MIKNSFRALLGVAAVVTLASAANANLLSNAGFEDPPFTGAESQCTGPADCGGWNSFGGAFRIQGQPPIGPAGAHGGDVALKVFGTAGVYQDFGASEGDSFDGSAWVLNDSADVMGGGQIAAVNIEWHGAGGFISATFGDSIDATAPVDTWTLLSVAGSAPAGTTFARFVLITGDFAPGGAIGAPRFDDATFDQRVVPVPAAVWLFGSGLAGLVGLRRRKNA